MTPRELAGSLGLGGVDYLVVADGSGNTCRTPCGWFARVWNLRTGRSADCYGGGSQGTNNVAELSPFLQSLYVIESWRPGWRGSADTTVVGCVSDSEMTVRCGQGRYSRAANGHLWAALQYFEDNGYELRWAHVPRNSNVFSALADRMAGRVRGLISGVKVG